MTTLIGRASWPGVEGYEGAASYTYRDGAAPAAASLTLPFGASPRAFGDLTFTDGVHTVSIRGAKLHEWVINYKSGVTTLAILDRRWRWAFSVIDGAYNVRHDGQNIPVGGGGIVNGGQIQEIIPSTLRTARELAALCLDTMGEVGYSLDGLPLLDYPGVHWDMTVAAEALESLCHQYDCVISLPPTTNKVQIVRRGTGDAPPVNFPLEEASPSVEVADSPAVVIAVGSDIEFDIAMRLKAIGDNTDGRLVDIDALSYAPNVPGLPAAAGTKWAADPPAIFGNISRLALLPGQFDRDAQAAWIHSLAAGSVFKKYQVDLTKNHANENKPPEITDFYGKGKPLLLTRLDQFQISDHRVYTALQATGFMAFIPAEVSGVFVRYHQWAEADTDSLGNSRNSEKINSGFSVDSRHNYLTFSQYVYKILGLGLLAPADLILQCAITLRDLTTYSPVRYAYGVAMGGAMPAGAVVVRRPELIMRYLVRYDLNNPGTSSPAVLRPISTESNRDDLDRVAATFAAAAASYYTNRPGGQWKYAGIIPIQANGSVGEITWSIDVNGAASTTASQNRSHADWLPTLEEVRTRFKVKPTVLGDLPRLKLPAVERSMRGNRVVSPGGLRILGGLPE